MSRPTTKVNTLHGYEIKELMDLIDSTNSKHTRHVLTTVIMRSRGYSNSQINEVTGLSHVTIASHIKNWNSMGIKSTIDRRGGNRSPSLSPDMEKDLINVVIHKRPTDFEFTGHTWTCALMALYIEQTYGINVSITTIWSTLKKNNLSYKRAMPKPTKADKAEQEAFKKNVRNTRHIRIFI